MIDWYHSYLNHPGGDRLAKTLEEVCYWKGLTNQAKQYAKPCEHCQKFKKRRSRYGNLPPKNIAKLKLWHMVHIDLIGPYTKNVKQHQPDNIIKDIDLQLCYMTFIDPATGWFEITEVPYYDTEEVRLGNNTYISKTSVIISQLFNNTRLSRYPKSQRVVFDNGSEFKNVLFYYCRTLT